MEENKNNQQQQNQFQMGISPEVAEGTYSNLALITHSSSDFILDFACALPGMPAPQIKSRVIMAPEHAKRLLQALQSNIYNYEQSIVYLTNLMSLTCIEQNTLRSSCLTSIDMRHDTDVTSQM